MYDPSVRLGLVITYSVMGQTSKGSYCIIGTLQDVPSEIPDQQQWVIVARIWDKVTTQTMG